MHIKIFLLALMFLLKTSISVAENRDFKLVFEDLSNGSKSEFLLNENTRFRINQNEIVFYDGIDTLFSLLGDIKILYSKETTTSIETINSSQNSYISWGYDSFCIHQSTKNGMCEIYNLNGVKYKMFRLSEQVTIIPFSELQDGISIIKLGNNTYKIKK